MTKVELVESTLNGSRTQLYKRLRSSSPNSPDIVIADDSLELTS